MLQGIEKSLAAGVRTADIEWMRDLSVPGAWCGAGLPLQEEELGRPKPTSLLSPARPRCLLIPSLCRGYVWHQVLI